MTGVIFPFTIFQPHSKGFKLHSINDVHSETWRKTLKLWYHADLSVGGSFDGTILEADAAIFIYMLYLKSVSVSSIFPLNINTNNLIPALPISFWELDESRKQSNSCFALFDFSRRRSGEALPFSCRADVVSQPPNAWIRSKYVTTVLSILDNADFTSSYFIWVLPSFF